MKEEVTDLESTSLLNNRRIIKVQGKGGVKTGYLLQPFGEDSNPVGLKAIYAQTQNENETVIIGFINPDVSVDIGEKKIFSTDENGVESFPVHLKNDGTAIVGGEGDFLVRYNELATAFNQLRDDLNTAIETINTIRLDQTTFANVYVAGGPAVQGLPPIYTTTSVAVADSVADITPAKIEEIETLPK